MVPPKVASGADRLERQAHHARASLGAHDGESEVVAGRELAGGTSESAGDGARGSRVVDRAEVIGDRHAALLS
jgi:hypothetical protein